MKGIKVKTPQVPKQKAKLKSVASKPKSKNVQEGAVTMMSTAPVAIGNSVHGCESVVVNKGVNGITVKGRDFMFAPIGTGSVTTWTLCGGTPLSPAAFADTTLGTYMRMYAKFRFKKFVVHYITSSPTSANGDVMFYYAKDRSSVFLNQTSPQLLGFVLSDPSTVLGPQWTNHSAAIDITTDWKLTDYGMHDGIEEYADGEIFLLSKTSTTDSPGYVLFDYEVEFAEHQLQPRLLTFPIPRIQWSQVNLGITATAVSQFDNIGGGKGLVVKGNGISGSVSSLPSGCKAGDIYKVVLDATNSGSGSWTGVTLSNAFGINNGGALPAVTISDGMTLYAVYTGTYNSFSLYSNATSAYSQSNSLDWFTTATITMNLQCWLSYLGNCTTDNLVPNY